MTVFTESPAHIALCFGCIEDSLPFGRKDSIMKVYEAYEAEMVYLQHSAKEKGLMLRPGEKSKAEVALDAWRTAMKQVPSGCIFTGEMVNESEHFVCHPIDRINSEKGTMPPHAWKAKRESMR